MPAAAGGRWFISTGSSAGPRTRSGAPPGRCAHGQRGEWRVVLREAAAETLREARRAASVYDTVRLKEAAGCYSRLAGCGYGEVAELMLEPEERRGAQSSRDRSHRRLEQSHRRCAGSDELPVENGRRRRGREGRGRARRHQLASA